MLITSAPQKAKTGGSLELQLHSLARKTQAPGSGQTESDSTPPHPCTGTHVDMRTADIQVNNCSIWIPQDNKNHIYTKTYIKTFTAILIAKNEMETYFTSE